MSDHSTPTTLRRQLGARLRALRQERGLTAEKVARDLGFSVSKVSRMETGARGVSQEDIASLIGYFDLDSEDRKVLQQIATQGRRRRRSSPQLDPMHTDDVTLQDSGFIELERDAVRIREFNSGVIPGLLQTEAYMRAGMVEGTPGIDEELVRRAMVQRRDRQRILQTSTHYEVIVDEAALLRKVGGALVMAEQVAAIRDAIAKDTVSLAVIPLASGAHPALNSMFVALTMGSEYVPDVVFIENVRGQLRVDKSEDVERFDRIWYQLQRRAESSTATGARLRELEADFQQRAQVSGSPAAPSG